VDDVSEGFCQHAFAFYNHLIPQADGAGETFKLIKCYKYDCILEALLHVHDGEALAMIQREHNQVHKWKKAYGLVNSGNNTWTVVARPLDAQGEEVDADTLKHVMYLERFFSDLVTNHGMDHNKGRTLYNRLSEVVSNCPCPVCKLFTDTCPHCIVCQQRNCPTAGLHLIITCGFNVHGQVNLIDFQSMLDGEFCYLLNYIDHGIKYLFSIPIVYKRASCITIVLFQVFTLIGPPIFYNMTTEANFTVLQ
jgi:hypothetical protein